MTQPTAMDLMSNCGSVETVLLGVIFAITLLTALFIDNERPVSLQQVLMFATESDTEPLLGFLV